MTNNLKLKDVIGKRNSKGFQQDLEYLQSSKNPIIIFGGGSAGYQVACYLKENGVIIDGFCESSYYYQNGKSLLDLPVYLYDDLRKIFPRYELVLAMNSGKCIHELVKSEEKIGNKVFSFTQRTQHFEMSQSWVEENVDLLNDTLDMLEDDLSRETFFSYLDDKAHCISFDVAPLWKLWVDEPYFNSLYVPTKYKNVMVDCGAWIGDTAQNFLDFVREEGYDGFVHAFEPEPKNYEKLLEISRETERIKCYKYAVGDEKKKVSFAVGNGENSCVVSDETGGEMVDMIAVDEILQDELISFIKMDLEGGEYNALLGMRNLIVKNAPYMAICVYHKIDDMIRIPQLIHSFANETGRKYRYYLRHHSSTSSETVFYAVPD